MNLLQVIGCVGLTVLGTFPEPRLLREVTLGRTNSGAPQASELFGDTYDDWARFKKGSWFRIEMRNEKDKATEECTCTLVEVTEGKVVVELTSVPAGGGKGNSTRYELEKGGLRLWKGPRKPDKEGDEELLVGDKKLACRWQEWLDRISQDGKAMTVVIRRWRCKDVPGGFVKEAHRGGGEGTTFSEILVAWGGEQK